MHERCTDPANSEFIGEFQPDNSLGIFNGESVHGHWTLTVEDAQAGHTGMFLGSRLHYVYQP